MREGGMERMAYERSPASIAEEELRLVKRKGGEAEILAAARKLNEVSDNRGDTLEVVRAVGKVWQERAGYKGDIFFTDFASELMSHGRGWFAVPSSVQKGEISLNRFFPNLGVDLGAISSTEGKPGYQWYRMSDIPAADNSEQALYELIRQSGHTPATINHYVLWNELSFELGGSRPDARIDKIDILLGSKYRGEPVYVSYHPDGSLELMDAEAARNSSRFLAAKMVKEDG